MMNCEQALEAISARLDGALSEEENRELEAHLASCASCRALLKELTELEEGLETLPSVSVKMMTLLLSSGSNIHS